MNFYYKKWFWFVTVIAIIAGIFLFMREDRPVDLDSLSDRGLIVVGFKKGISQLEAENLLKEYELQFLRTNNVNQGKIFFNESGEKFIVYIPQILVVEAGEGFTGDVPAANQKMWIDKFNELPQIYKANKYIDPGKVIVD